ncbi:trithorax group protein osa-like [Panonychus citri]|uniref:trithorax group protein osa-like n=1 Tax=Panonychus citri TaxID=50023 RepID=UPI0023072BFA|nr:trithorax group protein osa-like [Panonychus citri]
MSESALEDVKKIIKSLVIAHQNGLSPVALNNEFLEFEGRPIPWKSFGASSLFEFLKTLSDIIVPGSNRASEQVFFARVDSSTAHIANFVAHQKPTTIKRRNNIARNDLEKRPCRDPSPPPVPISVPIPIPQQPQHSPPPERSRPRRPGVSSSSNGNSDRRREPERSERRRYREPSPMSISPPPRRTPTPEPDRFRNPSPPRHGRSHSFRDASPDRPPRRQSARDVFLNGSPQATPPQDYDKELAKAREKRGLPAQSSRSRRSRSPSPRRHRSRPSPPPPSPPRRRSPPIQTRSVSCQTDKEKVISKKLVSASCQTDVEKAKTSTVVQQELAAGDENEVNLNQAYYGSSYGPSYGGHYNGGPYNGFSLQPVPDPSYEEDASRPGFYYDFDAGSHKQIPLIPEWYAYWIWTGWAPPTSQQPQQSQQQPLQSAYPPQQPTLPPNPNPHVHSTPTTTTTPVEAAQPTLKFIPTTPTNNSATRDPRLARQLAANANNTANAKQAQVPTKRKAVNVNDYLKSRKLVPDKSQFIINEEAQETPETLSNTLDYYVKLGAKRA